MPQFIEVGKTEALEGLIQYIVRCPFSLDRMLRVGNDGQVIYHAEHSDPRVFPLSGRADLLGGTKRNYRVFDPLDFLAEITQHIPEPGQHLIRKIFTHCGRWDDPANGPPRLQSPQTKCALCHLTLRLRPTTGPTTLLPCRRRRP